MTSKGNPASGVTRRGRRAALLAALAGVAASSARAQLPNSLAADRARLLEFTRADSGWRSSWDTLPRWTHTLRFDARAAAVSLFVVDPSAQLTWNSEIPFSLNDGPMWAGRGPNVSVGAGVGARTPVRDAMLQVVVAPTLAYSRNAPVPIIPATFAGRSAYSSPFHGPDASIDLPQRFGDRYLLRVDPGRSQISVTRRDLGLSLTATNEIWGPGIRNQLIMSANAPGIPRLEFATLRPIRTRIGSIDVRVLTGALTESLFFDTLSYNDYRSISGAFLTLVPAFDSTLSFGIARSVYRPVRSPVGGTFGHALDVLTIWEHVSAETDSAGIPRQRADQILAAFARWRFPSAGFELYAEGARLDLPSSLTDVFVAPQYSAGYTIGFQWAQARGRARFIRLQTELTYLEQSRVYPGKPLPEFYTGRRSPQGYTQRGQVVGAAIGPGASSQWVALDHLAPTWEYGGFLGRIRWENDALYRTQVPTLFKHDVTVLAGLRGARRTPVADFTVQASLGYRYNYLFQNGFANYGGLGTVDEHNVSISLSATPRGTWLR